MGIVLCGGANDGAAGLRIIRDHGGTALVQDPEEAAMPSMPPSALAADHPDASVPVAEIARRARVSVLAAQPPKRFRAVDEALKCDYPFRGNWLMILSHAGDLIPCRLGSEPR